MNFYTYLTPNFRPLFELFSETFPTDCDLYVRYDPAVSSSSYLSSGYNACLRKRWDWLLHVMPAEREPFVICDTDIMFRGLTKQWLLDQMRQDVDIMAQSEDPARSGVNCGFMLIRPTPKSYTFLHATVRGAFSEEGRREFDHDQAYLNARMDKSQVGLFDDRVWHPPLSKEPPVDAVVMHATCCKNIEEKLALFERLKRHV